MVVLVRRGNYPILCMLKELYQLQALQFAIQWQLLITNNDRSGSEINFSENRAGK